MDVKNRDDLKLQPWYYIEQTTSAPPVIGKSFSVFVDKLIQARCSCSFSRMAHFVHFLLLKSRCFPALRLVSRLQDDLSFFSPSPKFESMSLYCISQVFAGKKKNCWSKCHYNGPGLQNQCAEQIRAISLTRLKKTKKMRCSDCFFVLFFCAFLLLNSLIFDLQISILSVGTRHGTNSGNNF